MNTISCKNKQKKNKTSNQIQILITCTIYKKKLFIILQVLFAVVSYEFGYENILV